MNAVTLVCFAVPQEAKPFRAIAEQRADIRVVVTGMGRGNAQRAAREALKQFEPRRVVTSGFAGALDPELRVGDLIFDQSKAPDHMVPMLLELGIRPASFHCSERVAITAAEKSSLRSSTQADAVEMESAAIHDVCRELGVECLTVRVISDVANQDLPLDFNALMNSNHELSTGRLAWAIATRPQKIPALARLGKDSAHAAQELANGLSSLLEL